jgi:hypothetical protein
MSREAALKAWATRRARAAAQTAEATSDGLTEFCAPARFWQDHIDRSNDPEALEEAEVRATSKGVIVRLTADQLSELESDAEFYSYMGVAEYGFEYAGLISSAKATVKRVKALEGAA